MTAKPAVVETPTPATTAPTPTDRPQVIQDDAVEQVPSATSTASETVVTEEVEPTTTVATTEEVVDPEDKEIMDSERFNRVLQKRLAAIKAEVIEEAVKKQTAPLLAKFAEAEAEKVEQAHQLHIKNLAKANGIDEEQLADTELRGAKLDAYVTKHGARLRSEASQLTPLQQAWMGTSAAASSAATEPDPWAALSEAVKKAAGAKNR